MLSLIRELFIWKIQETTNRLVIFQ